jgi:2-polyprenyl-3-methyl-5-hydroxy-6-metoxy-1,4-benzoquinol methylase
MSSSDGYGWSSADPPHSCGYLAEPILEILGALQVGSVLDLGSGNGSLCWLLAERGFEVAGAEYDAEGYRIASEAHPRIRFYNLGVQDDPSEILRDRAAGFDAVVSTEVIEHLYSPQLLPQFAQRVLKPDGYPVPSISYRGYLKNLVLSVLGKWEAHPSSFWEGCHIKFWSRATLTRLLAEANSVVVDFSGIGRIPYLRKSMVLVARRVS